MMVERSYSGPATKKSLIDDLKDINIFFINCLSAAGSQYVSSGRPDIQKRWWTPEITKLTLKEQCIDITNVLKSIGRPRNGPINTERL